MVTDIFTDFTNYYGDAVYCWREIVCVTWAINFHVIRLSDFEKPKHQAQCLFRCFHGINHFSKSCQYPLLRLGKKSKCLMASLRVQKLAQLCIVWCTFYCVCPHHCPYTPTPEIALSAFDNCLFLYFLFIFLSNLVVLSITTLKSHLW